jgi:deoxyribodipyrimidine photo-lyase
MSIGLFIYRRDLRIHDNSALINAMKKCDKVYTIFIFTQEQVTEKNSYKSDISVKFMIKSLMELDTQLRDKGGRLFTFFGKNEVIVKKLIEDWNIDSLFWNRDYSPYAKKRDNQLIDLCKKMNIQCNVSEDYYINPPGSILTGNDTSYLKYTPYLNKALENGCSLPNKSQAKNLVGKNMRKSLSYPISLREALDEFVDTSVESPSTYKRAVVLRILKGKTKFNNYEETRNDLDLETTRLSAPIKYGIVSIREVYHIFKNNEAFIRQLIWRDFYAQILDAYPQVLGSALKEHYNSIKWSGSHSHFVKWCNGETGYPIVDAGMRELNQTGYMHNRARLITASFLIKTLLIDWQKGEKYYATKLVDYDPASNNGNWQWVASTGADSQPYFRIFNPWLQSKEHDPNAEYIKKWIPELGDVEAKYIHQWNDFYKDYKHIGYPSPIVDYKQQKEKALKMYKDVV